MYEKEYLRQISQSTKPKKSKKNSFMSSPIFKAIAIGIVAFIVIVIIGGIIGGNKEDIKKQLATFDLHLTNTSALVSTYQKNVKSSDLRSTSASLYSVLTNTSHKIEDYLQKKYNFKMSSVDKDLKEQATLEKDGLEAELSKAWINGMLDSVFATKAQEEISAFMKEASELRDATNDDELREILDSSYSSLKTLYDKFGSF